jgi:pyruvate/2-oxoglutarate dehydrogenase complex dihydrolipoamide dehydrogenase (E3) component
VRAGRVQRYGDARTLTFSDEGHGPLEVDEVLVCAGRRPNVDGLGLDAAGVDHDERHGLRVDDLLRTTNHAVYAAGDCCTAARYTHVADAQGRLVVRNALLFGTERATRLTTPRVTFTDPEVAHAGRTASEAEADGLDVETVRVPLAELDRAAIEDDLRGFLALHVERGGDRLVGATLVGPDAGEALAGLAVALHAEVPVSSLARLVVPYPTRAEAIHRAAAEALERRSAGTIGRLLLRGLMALRR